MSKTVLFHTIQFSIGTQFSSIWPIYWTQSRVTNPGQSGPGSDGVEGVLRREKRLLLPLFPLFLIFIHVVFWLVNTSSSNKPRYVRKIVIFSGKIIYKRETVRNKNIELVIE